MIAEVIKNITSELPARRHIDLVEVQRVRIEYLGHLIRKRVEFEVPLSVEASHLWRLIAFLSRADRVGRLPVGIRYEIAPRSQFVCLEDIEITIICFIDPVSHQAVLLKIQILKLADPA